MQELPTPKKIYFNVLGQIYLWTYATKLRKWLGLSVSSYIQRLPWLLVLIGLVNQWRVLTIILFVLALIINVVYWYAYRVGYNKFVPKPADNTQPISLPTDELDPLAANQRINLWATGLFSVQDREDSVLLRPAEYWQVPLGEHIVMVQQVPGHYLYQFFNAASLQQVKEGWLIFGSTLKDSLAITFQLTWGPSFTQYDTLYYIQKEKNLREAPLRTIYFTFDNAADKQAVWHNIIRDARRVRSA